MEQLKIFQIFSKRSTANGKKALRQAKTDRFPNERKMIEE